MPGTAMAKGANMARKQTFNLCARVPAETDALRTELERALNAPLPDVINRAFRALKSELVNRRHRTEEPED
jgi:hypothetical protein